MGMKGQKMDSISKPNYTLLAQKYKQKYLKLKRRGGSAEMYRDRQALSKSDIIQQNKRYLEIVESVIDDIIKVIHDPETRSSLDILKMENNGLKLKYHENNNDIVTQDPGYQNINGVIKTILCQKVTQDPEKFRHLCQKWQKLDDNLYSHACCRDRYTGSCWQNFGAMVTGSNEDQKSIQQRKEEMERLNITNKICLGTNKWDQVKLMEKQMEKQMEKKQQAYKKCISQKYLWLSSGDKEEYCRNVADNIGGD